MQHIPVQIIVRGTFIKKRNNPFSIKLHTIVGNINDTNNTIIHGLKTELINKLIEKGINLFKS